MILFNTRLQLAEEKKRHLLEQVSGNESNRLDLSSKFFQGWWLFGVGTFRSNLRSCFNFFFEFFFCIISMVAWYGCRRENTKWENILNIFRAFQKNGSNYISKNSSYYTRCGRRTFLPVLRHLITLNLPDYCPIISRIKFWWFSFFLNLKTDLWKPRYQFFRRQTFAPKNLGGGTATFDFLHSDLFATVYLVFLRICVCVSVFVFVFVFVFLSFLLYLFKTHSPSRRTEVVVLIPEMSDFF